MKKKIFLSAIAITTFFSVQAQGPYAGVSATYGFPVAGNVLGHVFSEDISANTGSYENVKGSFGSGMTVGSYFGYMFNPNFGFEIGASYLWGKTYKFKSNTDYSSGNYNHETDEVSASTFRVSPAVRISFGEGKLHPYLRCGMTAGLFNKMVDNYTENSLSPPASNPDITERRLELTKGTSIGFTGALGLDYLFSGNVYLFAEVTNYTISWGPGKGEFTKSVYNGTDMLPGMDISEKEFEFTDKTERTSTTDPNSPTVALKTYFPMSSIGLTMGVHFAFGK